MRRNLDLRDIPLPVRLALLVCMPALPIGTLVFALVGGAFADRYYLVFLASAFGILALAMCAWFLWVVAWRPHEVWQQGSPSTPDAGHGMEIPLCEPGAGGLPPSVSIAGSIAAMLMIVTLLLAGVARPDLLGTSAGWLFAPRTASVLFVVALVWTLWELIRAARERRRAVQQAEWVRRLAGQAVAHPSRPSAAAGGGLLDVRVAPGYAIAAVAVALVFGAGAFAIAAMPVSSLLSLTTDGRGDIYALVGSTLYKTGLDGDVMLKVDLASDSLQVAPDDVYVDENGLIYLADSQAGQIVVLDGSGRPVRHMRTMPSLLGDVRIAVSAAQGMVYVLNQGELARIDQADKRDVLFSDAKCRFSSDVCVASDGRIFIPDAVNERLLVLKGSIVTPIDCSSADGEYVCPDMVTADGAGTVYAVLRKKWGDTPGAVVSPGSAREAPGIWMGRVYAIAGGATDLKPVPLAAADVGPLNVFDVAALPDGRLLVNPLDMDRIYIAEPSGVVARWDKGELGRALAEADRRERLHFAGPIAMGALAVVLAFAVAGYGAVASRRDAG